MGPVALLEAKEAIIGENGRHSFVAHVTYIFPTQIIFREMATKLANFKLNK